MIGREEELMDEINIPDFAFVALFSFLETSLGAVEGISDQIFGPRPVEIKLAQRPETTSSRGGPPSLKQAGLWG